MKKLLLINFVFISGIGFSQIGFFYQTVGPMISGSGTNTVQIGSTSDGQTIHTNQVTALDFTVGASADSAYGDPVFSYLSNGNWSVSAWSGPTDPRGPGKMLYYEGPCPVVNDNQVIALGAANTAGCYAMGTFQIGKTSQVFSINNKNYILHSNNLGVNITYLSDATHSAMSLTQICVKNPAPASLSLLNYGESMPIYHSDSLFLSDCAIAKRADGTYVLFLKGISSTNPPSSGSLAELEQRGIYRLTTTDFINFSPIEKVVSSASVPEATQTSDGKVWLYWQDFTDAVAANNLNLAARAPISGAFEQNGTNTLSTPVQVTFSDEAFETNTSLHYATNGNPICLPDASALTDFENCIVANGGVWNTTSLFDQGLETLKVYPNPTSNKVTIESSVSCSIDLYNITGQPIQQVAISTLHHTFDLSHLSNGIYFLHIKTDHDQQVIRVEKN